MIYVRMEAELTMLTILTDQAKKTKRNREKKMRSWAQNRTAKIGFVQDRDYLPYHSDHFALRYIPDGIDKYILFLF